MKHIFRKKVDGNQGQIVENLRAVGCSVISIASIGQGAPDILVGICGINLIFEIKDPSQPKSARKLTAAEEKFALSWGGQVHTIETTEQAIEIIKAEKNKRKIV